MIETPEQIGGRKLEAGAVFHFQCRPGLDCFNSCCRDKRLPLWPYDLLRLRRGLDLPSDRILEEYAELEMDPVSGWPALRLKLDVRGRCPLLTEAGCRVYDHRPAACRIYPLARAAALRHGRAEAVYFRQEAPKCLGWGQEREHNLASWTADQGLEPYDRANDRLLPLLFHPKRKGRLNLTQRQVHAVLVALYNLDVFRRMLGQPDFARRFNPAGVEEAMTADETVLDLGIEFLLTTLFGDQG